MQILISDANVLIDMEEGGLIEKMFKLPYNFLVPDMLYEDELSQQHSHLVGYGLKLAPLSPESLMYGMELARNHRGPSTNDCFALALAKQEKCPLISGDKALRKAAEKELVFVRGTVWLLLEMLRHHIVTPGDARVALNLMKANFRRLPWDIAEASITQFETEVA